MGFANSNRRFLALLRIGKALLCHLEEPNSRLTVAFETVLLVCSQETMCARGVLLSVAHMSLSERQEIAGILAEVITLAFPTVGRVIVSHAYIIRPLSSPAIIKSKNRGTSLQGRRVVTRRRSPAILAGARGLVEITPSVFCHLIRTVIIMTVFFAAIGTLPNHHIEAHNSGGDRSTSVEDSPQSSSHFGEHFLQQFFLGLIHFFTPSQ